MKPRARRASSAWIACAVVACAVWVNWPHVSSWFAKVGEVVLPRTTRARPVVKADASDRPAAAPKLPGPAAAFAPVALEEEVRDPFLHSRRVAVRRSIAPPRALPAVTLVICASGSGTACVDGKVVGVGDRVSIGTITEVAAGGVRVRTALGEEVFIPLAAERTETAGDGNPDSKPGGGGTARRR